MSLSKALRLISGICEGLLAIPILGGLFVISSGYAALGFMFVFHLIVLFVSLSHREPCTAAPPASPPRCSAGFRSSAFSCTSSPRCCSSCRRSKAVLAVPSITVRLHGTKDTKLKLRRSNPAYPPRAALPEAFCRSLAPLPGLPLSSRAC